MTVVDTAMCYTIGQLLGVVWLVLKYQHHRTMEPVSRHMVMVIRGTNIVQKI